MGEYCIYLFNADETLAEQQTMTFARDEDAIEFVRTIAHCHQIDIWQGERLVAQFSEGPPAST